MLMNSIFLVRYIVSQFSKVYVVYLLICEAADAATSMERCWAAATANTDCQSVAPPLPTGASEIENGATPSFGPKMPIDVGVDSPLALAFGPPPPPPALYSASSNLKATRKHRIKARFAWSKTKH